MTGPVCKKNETKFIIKRVKQTSKYAIILKNERMMRYRTDLKSKEFKENL